MRIAPAHFKVIEHELYNYDDTKARYRALKDDMINGMQADDDVRVQAGIGNPTSAKAMELVSNTELMYMAWTLRGIERALVMLDEQHNEIFEFKYRQRLHWREVMKEAHLSERSYFRKRRELITAVAVQWGIASP